MSAAERASEASSVEQANKWAVRVNERTDERVAQYLRLYFWLIQTTVERKPIEKKVGERRVKKTISWFNVSVQLVRYEWSFTRNCPLVTVRFHKYKEQTSSDQNPISDIDRDDSDTQQ